MGNTSSQKEAVEKTHTYSTELKKPLEEPIRGVGTIPDTVDDASGNNIPPYHSKLRTHINTELNSYQYFRSPPPQRDVSDQFGIDTKKDNKFCKKIDTLYNDELNYRKTVDCSQEKPYTREELDTELMYNYGNTRNSTHNPDHNSTHNHPPNSTHTNDASDNRHYINQTHTSRPNSPNTTVPDEITITRDQALVIKDNRYLTNLEKRIMIMNNILINDIDPLDIQSTEKLRLSKLIEKYTALRNIYHPDKSLSESGTMFITVNSALEKLKYIKRSIIVDKDFNQLKQDYGNYNNVEKKNPFLSSGVSQTITPEKFNEFYDEHKYNDIYEDDGYGDIMVEGGVREDIDIKPITISENNTFLDQFEKNIPESRHNKIIEYNVPEPCNTDHNCANICSRSSQFTGKSDSIEYYDYKNAFELSDIDRNATTDDISYEDYIKARKTDSLEISDDKKRIIDEYDTKRNDDEKTRQNKFGDYMHHIEKYNNNLNKFTLEN